MSELHVKGLEQLYKTLNALPDKMAKKVWGSASSAMASTIAKQARKEAPYGRGQDAGRTKVKTKKKTVHLRDTIKIKKLRSSRTSINYVVHAGLGIRYAHLVEFGSAPHTIRPKTAKALGFEYLVRESAEHPGTRPNRFMTRAFSKTHKEAMEAFKIRAWKQIEKLGL